PAFLWDSRSRLEPTRSWVGSAQWEGVVMKTALLAILLACPAILWCKRGEAVAAEPPRESTRPANAAARGVIAQAVVTAAYVPYVVDRIWQSPLSGRLGWATTAAANPNPGRAPARVFLLRGSGTVFSPGFGELCTRLRRTEIWAEDLGSAGAPWVCQ